MKISVLLLLVGISAKGLSQSSPDTRKIDSLVNHINATPYTTTVDSIIQDMSQIGLFMRTYITVAMDGAQLKKYINYVKTVRVEQGKTTKMTTSNNFYFNNGQLIKVEDILAEEGKGKDNRVFSFAWYYDGERYAYPQPVSEKNDQRAELLLTLGRELLKKMQSK
jgi:hypothetical protein